MAVFFMQDVKNPANAAEWKNPKIFPLRMEERKVENTPTVVRVCSYIDPNGCLDYDCIDLQNNQDITEKVDLWEDIM